MKSKKNTFLSKNISKLFYIAIVISNLQAMNYEIKEGWQLLGAIENLNLEIFNANCIEEMWKYDGGWETYNPNEQTNTNTIKISTLNKGEGFWLKANSDCSINTEIAVEITSNTNKTLPSSIILKEIDGGTFIMGKTTQIGDSPEVNITLSPFQISEKEITNAEYIEFLNSAYQDGWISVEKQKTVDPCGEYNENMIIGAGDAPYAGEIFVQLGETGGCTSDGYEEYIDNKSWISFNTSEEKFELLDESKANWPVNWVRWYGAFAFSEYYGVNLPTEAQWEYSAKGGKQFDYPTNDGKISDTQANYNGDQPGVHSETGHVKEVGSYLPNPYGIYDMGGNVWEWCQDYYASDFYTDGVVDPVNTTMGIDGKRVRRGGSWNYHSATLLTYARASDLPNRGNNHFGFRIVNNY